MRRNTNVLAVNIDIDINNIRSITEVYKALKEHDGIRKS
jgi:hypothetical protein